MSHPRESDEKLDPDYEVFSTALGVTLEDEKKEKIAKIRKIIEEEYNKDILARQENIKKLELQLCKSRKLLHLVRYAAVTNFYNNHGLLEDPAEEKLPIAGPSETFSSQSRIHPAVKKLLSGQSHSMHIDSRRTKRDRKRSVPSALPEVKSEPVTPVEPVEYKRIKIEPMGNSTVTSSHASNGRDSTSRSFQQNVDMSKSRRKVKYRIVVGNTSKWMPSSEDDNLTHKWLVYVRGPQGSPDVSHFIQKIVFYLHPSYRPHDVVEVSDSKFHLCRRGWGEFPIRLKIFFKAEINKPVEVIHNIKLDKTCSGRQTLGSETIVDLLLYDFDSDEASNPGPSSAVDSPHRFRPTNGHTAFDSNASTSQEHNYCSEDVNVENSHIESEHSYSVFPSGSVEIVKKEDRTSESVEQDYSNSLIYGLGQYLDLETKAKQSTVVALKKNFFFTSRELKFVRADPWLGRKLKEVSTKSLMTMQQELNSFRVSVSRLKFKNMGEALLYVFKKVPLISELANVPAYRRLYPFTCPSPKEFRSWNIGKQRSAEWSRARTIKNLLKTERIFGSENWTTKAVLMFGRSHHFTPNPSFGLFKRESLEKEQLLCCYTQSCPDVPQFSLEGHASETDAPINIDLDPEESPKNKSPIDISDPNVALECSYVRQTALGAGVILRSEEIEDGIVVNGAERMILAAVKCLANNLVRRAVNHSVCVNGSSSTCAISQEDVRVALSERDDLNALSKYKQKQSEMFWL